MSEEHTEILQNSDDDKLDFSALDYRFRTVPYDPRFPNQNQTRNCWQNYVDFHKCIAAKGEDFKPCHIFKEYYRALCPNSWVSFFLCLILFLVEIVLTPRSRDGTLLWKKKDHLLISSLQLFLKNKCGIRVKY